MSEFGNIAEEQFRQTGKPQMANILRSSRGKRKVSCKNMAEADRSELVQILEGEFTGHGDGNVGQICGNQVHITLTVHKGDSSTGKESSSAPANSEGRPSHVHVEQ